MNNPKTGTKAASMGALFATLVLGAGLACAQNQSPNQPAQRDKVQPDQVAGSTGGLSNTGDKTNPNAAQPAKKSKSKKMSSASATGDGTPTTNTKAGDNADTTAPDTGAKGSLVTNRVPPAPK